MVLGFVGFFRLSRQFLASSEHLPAPVAFARCGASLAPPRPFLWVLNLWNFRALFGRCALAKLRGSPGFYSRYTAAGPSGSLAESRAGRYCKPYVIYCGFHGFLTASDKKSAPLSVVRGGAFSM